MAVEPLVLSKETVSILNPNWYTRETLCFLKSNPFISALLQDKKFQKAFYEKYPLESEEKDLEEEILKEVYRRINKRAQTTGKTVLSLEHLFGIGVNHNRTEVKRIVLILLFPELYKA